MRQNLPTEEKGNLGNLTRMGKTPTTNKFSPNYVLCEIVLIENDIITKHVSSFRTKMESVFHVMGHVQKLVYSPALSMLEILISYKTVP